MTSVKIDFVPTFKRLGVDTEIKPFESEDDELNDFLLDDAKNYLSQLLAVTYLIENDTDTIGSPAKPRVSKKITTFVLLIFI